MTAVANDYSFDIVYARLVEAYATMAMSYLDFPHQVILPIFVKPLKWPEAKGS
jgi:hypothetical protein